MTRNERHPEFYRDGNTYVALTGEYPKDFKGYLFVALTGKNPGTVTETCVTRDNIAKMTLVEGTDVPDDWAEAFEKAGLAVPRPVAETVEEPVLEPVEIRPLPLRRPRRRNNRATTELFHGHLAADCDIVTAAAASGFEFGDDDEIEVIGPPTKCEALFWLAAAWAFTFWLLGVLA